VRPLTSTFRAGTLTLAALVAALLVPAAARADNPFETTAGNTLNPIVGGVHESFDDTIHLPPIPVPLIEASQQLGPFEVAGYGLPPTVAIPYTDAIQGSVALRLTIFDASLRLWSPFHLVAVEAGETIYNQTTHYQTADVSHPGTDERQYSRIAGAHYGVVVHLPIFKGFLETEVRYAPVLLGTQVTTYGDNSPTDFAPERGQQIDADVRYIRNVGHHTQMIVGARYVNFTAAYDVPSKPLSDRNAAFLPSFGYRFTTGP
jgi:hypothetical protein